MAVPFTVLPAAPRIGAVEDDLAAAVRQYRIGEQQQVFRVVCHALGRGRRKTAPCRY